MLVSTALCASYPHPVHIAATARRRGLGGFSPVPPAAPRVVPATGHRALGLQPRSPLYTQCASELSWLLTGFKCLFFMCHVQCGILINV